MNMRENMRKFLPAVVFMILLPAAAYSIEKTCNFCHIDHKGKNKGGGTLLKKNINELCADCHQKRLGAGEHKVGMKPEKPVAGLPLQDGKITCISCHDPHSKTTAMLRMPTKKLCVLCHEK